MADSTHLSEREAGRGHGRVRILGRWTHDTGDLEHYLGGQLDVKFTNVRWPNEPFTTRGVITSRTEDQERTRAHVTVVREKVDGIKIIVAAVSALENI